MRVVIADDSVLLREGVARLLTDAGFEVVAQAGDADDLLRKVRAHKPDVAIVDVRMPPDHTDEACAPPARSATSSPTSASSSCPSTSRPSTPASSSQTAPTASATSSRTASPTSTASPKPSAKSPPAAPRWTLKSSLAC